MAKREGILNAALKALLAGVETTAWLKIPATFISEIASLSKEKKEALDTTLPSEQFEELLTQAELSTTNAALAAVGTEQIKVLVANLMKLSQKKLDVLAKLTQEQYKETLNKLDAIHADTKEIREDVKELLEKADITDGSRTTIKDIGNVGNIGDHGTTVYGNQIINIHPQSSEKKHDPEPRGVTRKTVTVLIDEDHYKFKKNYAS